LAPPAADAPLLGCRGVTKRFGGVTALAGVDLAIDAGTVHALVGENGAGKSTLIKCWAGVHPPDAGTLTLDGAPVAFDSPRAAEAAGLRFIHQELSLVPHFDAVENVFLGRRYPTARGRIDWRAMRREVAARAGVLAPGLPLDVPARRLSVGQRQLVEILRAFLSDARLVVMDEPTTALTDAEAERLFAAIRRLRDRGTAVVYVSHRLEEVLALADTVTVLRDGATVASRPAAELDTRALVHLMSGALHDMEVETERRAGAPLLEVEELVAGRDPHGMTFTVHEREVVGLYGLMGAGRSTALHALYGAAPLTGRVSLDGTPFRPAEPAAAIARGVVLVPEDRRRQGLVGHHAVRRNLTLPLLKRFRATRLPVPSGAKERAFVDRVADVLSLRYAGPEQPVRELSGGNQQKLVVGRWFAGGNRVYLLDEPTRGVDVHAKAELHAEIRRLAAAGAGVLVASSDLPELLDVADRILAVRDGAIAAEFPRGQATQAAILAACYGQAA